MQGEEKEHHFLFILLNKFLKHVAAIVFKLNNHT